MRPDEEYPGLLEFIKEYHRQANKALSDLREVVSELEDGAVTGQYAARKLFNRMNAAHRALREAGDELRAAYGIDP